MRDLKADLKWLEECQSNRDLDDEYLAKKGDTTREEYQNYAPDFSYGITFVESTIAHEWLQRAIAAEKIQIELEDYIVKVSDVLSQKANDVAALTEENNKMKEQLANHRSAISIIHSYIHPHKSPRYSEFIDDVCDRILYAKDSEGGD